MPPLRAGLARVTQEGWASTGTPLAPSLVTRHYGQVCGAGGIVAADPGIAGYWVARTFATTELGGAQVPAAAGAHGFAVACALVARLRSPNRPVLAVVDEPMPEIVHEALDVAGRLGVAVPVEVWGADGERCAADDHLARLRSLVNAEHPRPVDARGRRQPAGAHDRGRGRRGRLAPLTRSDCRPPSVDTGRRMEKLAGRYELGDALGQGRSTVYRAVDTRLRRHVAIKRVQLLAGQEDADQVRTRALREAQASARLNNPAVVTVYDVVEEDGAIWLVMELVDGPSLAQIVSTRARCRTARAARSGSACSPRSRPPTWSASCTATSSRPTSWSPTATGPS